MQTTTLTTADTTGITFGRSYWIRVGFGIPWIIFGIQHFMYADFVATLVPAYMPWRLFWAYATGASMFAAGVSFIVRWQMKLAAFLLGCLMVLYLLMVHPPLLSKEPQVGQHWTRFMQDIAIMGAVFALALLSGPWRTGAGRRETDAPGLIVRYCYALPMIVLGAQHFTHNAFVTAKVPAWAPFVDLWDYIIGLALIAGALGILFAPERTGRITRRWAANALATMLIVLALLQHVPLLVTDVHNPGVWTGSMLDIALAMGGFIVAETIERHA